MQSAHSTSDDHDGSVYLTILRNRSEPILYEDAEWFVLFSKTPSNEGHLMVVPKDKQARFFDLPDSVLNRGFEVATKLSRVLNDVYKPPRIAMYIKGFTVDNHAHIHVSPAYDTKDLNIDSLHVRHKLSSEEMFILANKLQSRIDKAMGVAETK